MKFRNQARLCLAISDFEAHNMKGRLYKIDPSPLPVRTHRKFRKI